MTSNNTRIIHVNDLPQGGFAGIVETQMVISPKLMSAASSRADISHGLGSFVYLSTGYFKPNDGAPIHPHENVDIVTLVLSGQIAHKGSLGDGTVINAPGVQVQRAGVGMLHSEINTDNAPAKFVQIWFLPPQNGLTPAYQDFSLLPNKLTTVLDGDSSHEASAHFDNQMTCQIGTLEKGKTLLLEVAFIAFVTQGEAIINGLTVTEGDLIEGEHLDLQTIAELGLVLIY
ncbi:MAG: hypothetical protein methR_P0896 [Methyloprofundus sp.]|nr:MAG: hypothetical protein methR_P0896 [Methyloprofundus sp.]